MEPEKIKELINRRRHQVLVHSFLYYRLNTSIIDDHTFDRWSKELADLQEKYPEIARSCVYADAFEGFDGSSGFDLPIHLPEIISRGYRLLEIHRRRGEKK